MLTNSERDRRADARAAPGPRLERRFEAIVFDWDGTAVPDRRAEAARVRELVEELCSLGMELAVITGTNVDNVDGQLRARPPGPGRLLLCMNRGSEVFLADESGVRLLESRVATAEENASLDRSAEAMVAELARRGLRAEIVAQRLNRRKIDLIPEAEWADPPKARISELLTAVEARLRAAGLHGLDEAVALGEEAARTAGLSDPRVTTDAKHVEIGLTDKSDAAHWVFADLARRGIAPGLVLVAGDEFGSLGGLAGSDSLLVVPEAARAAVVSVGAEPTGTPPGVISLGGGPERFVALLEDQLERRRRGDVPDVDDDPAWSVSVDAVDPRLEGAHESWLTLADGRLGTRGSTVLTHDASNPAVVAAGVYTGVGAAEELAENPEWAELGRLPEGSTARRRLDLRTGLMAQEVTLAQGNLKTLQFVSLSRPGTAVLRAQAPDPELPPAGRRAAHGGLTAVFDDARRNGTLQRLAAYGVDEQSAARDLTDLQAAGFERLLTEQRGAWGRRWEHADVLVEGDPELQRAIRFNLFHLMASVADHGEAAVGARGLTGSAYKGHVFWDSDVYVLPFLAATHPPAARAMLEYRIRRLPAAREAARRWGRKGVRFPWESASDGFDVTPRAVSDATGKLVRVRTGELEEHITADVAWAAVVYADWSGDDTFAAGAGRDLLLETARYWASRIRVDGRGRGHIYGVIGPDEYHEPVDDNAYTNVMARWNLKRAAALTDEPGERSAWLRLAECLVDGYDPETGLYEQFAGFYGLEPLIIADIAPSRPLTADILLGRPRTQGSQVLKQPDVVMLHHMVPDEVAPGSLAPNVEFYEPRTAHGSSLSLPIYAAVLARAGRLDDAVAAFRLAVRLDLDDVAGNSSTGLHLATMGGVWQALVFGFAGVRPQGGSLIVEPHVPPEWGSLEVRLLFHGRPIALVLTTDSLTARGDGFSVTGGDGSWRVTPG